MKNKILVLISFLLLPFFVYAKDAIHFIPVSNSDAFLIESNGKYTLVDSSNPDKDDKVRMKITRPTSGINDFYVVGNKVRITLNGMVETSNPAQIGTNIIELITN